MQFAKGISKIVAKQRLYDDLAFIIQGIFELYVYLCFKDDGCAGSSLEIVPEPAEDR